MRPLGQITGEMEELIMEMCDDHEMQWGEIFAVIRGYLEIHRPDAQEVYEDGSNPVYFYGAIEED